MRMIMNESEAHEVIVRLKRLQGEGTAIVLIPERLHNQADIHNYVVADLIEWMREHTPTGQIRKATIDRFDVGHESDGETGEPRPAIVVRQNQEIIYAVFTDEREALAFESIWG